MLLAVLTSPNKVFGVYIHGRPIESTLPNLRLRAKYAIMSSVWCCMAFLNNIDPFYCGNTPF
jgi:hypothetical protein